MSDIHASVKYSYALRVQKPLGKLFQWRGKHPLASPWVSEMPAPIAMTKLPNWSTEIIIPPPFKGMPHLNLVAYKEEWSPRNLHQPALSE